MRLSLLPNVYHTTQLVNMPNHLLNQTDPFREHGDPGHQSNPWQDLLGPVLYQPLQILSVCSFNPDLSSIYILFYRKPKKVYYLHREHTPWLVPERCGGIVGVEGTQGGISLIGEGCGVQCSKVKDHVVKDKLHLDPRVLGWARESRCAAHEEVGGVHKTRLLKL